MRNIHKIVIHCSATGCKPQITAEVINQWHLKRGWSGIGYHFVIDSNGRLEFGRPLERAGAHAKGHNRFSIGICMVGGINEETKKPENNFSWSQWQTLKSLLKLLYITFGCVRTVGHRDLPNVNKDCPCFDVSEWLKKENF